MVSLRALTRSRDGRTPGALAADQDFRDEVKLDSIQTLFLAR